MHSKRRNPWPSVGHRICPYLLWNPAITRPELEPNKCFLSGVTLNVILSIVPVTA